MRKRPLFKVTFLILFAMVVIAVVPLTIFNIQGFKDFFYTETETNLLENCSMLKNLFPSCSSEDTDTLANYTERISESTSLRVTIINEDGQVLSDSHNRPEDMNNHSDRSEIKAAVATGYGSSIRNSATMAHEMMYAAVRVYFSNGTKGTIRLARSLKEIESRIYRITRSTIFICLFALGLTA